MNSNYEFHYRNEESYEGNNLIVQKLSNTKIFLLFDLRSSCRLYVCNTFHFIYYSNCVVS